VRQRGAWWRLAALILTLALAGGAAWKFLPRRGAGANYLAVLPFTNLSGDPAQEYLCEGITEELITELSRLQGDGFRILGPGSSLSLRHSSKPPRQIAQELGANHILEGTVRADGDRLRVTFHLVRVKDWTHLCDENYEKHVSDVLGFQAEVAESIAGTISQRLAKNPPRPARVLKGEAFELYAKGRFFWNKRTPAELLHALACFDKAARMDANYAPIQVGIADCYALLGSAEMGIIAPNEALPKAKAAVEKALALDPNSAEAHASLAYLKLIYDWDWAGAEKAFRRSIQLNPNYPTAHQWYALLLSILGRTGDALAELDRAELLDPLSPTVKTARAECLYFARRYDEAIVAARAALELDPAFMLAHVNLGRALAMKGDAAGAAGIFAKAREQAGQAPGLTMLLGAAYARQGDRGRAQAMLEALRHPPVFAGRPLYVPAIYFAAIHSGLGEADPTFRYLDKALGERCEYLIYLGRDPMADAMRGDPRFRVILDQVGLPRI
jgi:TolB-like protein/Flp pilus assembly protein TadD